MAWAAAEAHPRRPWSSARISAVVEKAIGCTLVEKKKGPISVSLGRCKLVWLCSSAMVNHKIARQNLLSSAFPPPHHHHNQLSSEDVTSLPISTPLPRPSYYTWDPLLLPPNRLMALPMRDWDFSWILFLQCSRPKGSRYASNNNDE